jgi:cysteine-rich repeat protein
MMDGMRKCSTAWLCTVLLVGCVDRGVPLGGEDDDAGASDATDTNGSNASGDSVGDAGPRCGDGVVDPGEACDDGNDIDGDGCNRDCVVSGTELWAVDLPWERGCHDVAVDVMGSIYVIGGKDGNAPRPTFAARLGPLDGAPIWETSYYPPVGEGSAWRVHGLRGRGGYVSLGGFLIDPLSTMETWLQMRDPEGNIIWDLYDIEPDYNEMSYGFVLDAHDGIWWFVEVSQLDWAQSWRELRRVTVDGTLDWTRPAYDPTPAYSHAAADPGGGVVFIGPVYTGYNLGRVLMTRFDRDGYEAETMELGDYPDESVNDLSVAPNNDVVIVQDMPHPEPPLSTRLIVRRYRGTELLTEFSHGDPDTSRTNPRPLVATDSAGNIVVAANEATRHPDGSHESRVRLGKYTPEGDSLWDHVFEAKFEQCGLAVAPDDTIVLSLSDSSTEVVVHKFAP